jgi:hypothetical protein
MEVISVDSSLPNVGEVVKGNKLDNPQKVLVVVY